jgi:hypothetical protein
MNIAINFLDSNLPRHPHLPWFFILKKTNYKQLYCTVPKDETQINWYKTCNQPYEYLSFLLLK